MPSFRRPLLGAIPLPNHDQGFLQIPGTLVVTEIAGYKLPSRGASDRAVDLVSLSGYPCHFVAFSPPSVFSSYFAGKIQLTGEKCLMPHMRQCKAGPCRRADLSAGMKTNVSGKMIPEKERNPISGLAVVFFGKNEILCIWLSQDPHL